MYRPIEIRCRLHTGGKSVDEFRRRYTGQGLTWRNFESLKRAFDLFDGQQINLFRKGAGDEAVYYVAVWPKANTRIMEGVYEMEQTHPEPVYIGRKERFVMDWMAGTYTARMAVAFLPEDVEELEVVREEANEPDQDPAPVEKPRWRQVKEKRARRRKGARKP